MRDIVLTAHPAVESPSEIVRFVLKSSDPAATTNSPSAAVLAMVVIVTIAPRIPIAVTIATANLPTIVVAIVTP